MKRVLVTGATTVLGAAVIARLRRHDDMTISEAGPDISDYEHVAERIIDQHVDTIIDTRLVRWSPAVHADVIGTMRLAAAAAQPGSAVRTVAAASSVVVYPASSRAPRRRRESELLDPAPGSVAGRLLEAERYLRALADANPHICVAVLRLADLTGSPPHGPLAKLLSGPIVPGIAGFDAPVQLLDLDDAARALEHASSHSLAGTYNVAGDGALHWSAAADHAHKRLIPTLAPPSWLTTLTHKVGLRLLGPDTVDVLRFGRIVDTGLIAATGFAPIHNTAACAERSSPHTVHSDRPDPTDREAANGWDADDHAVNPATAH